MRCWKCLLEGKEPTGSKYPDVAMYNGQSLCYEHLKKEIYIDPEELEISLKAQATQSAPSGIGIPESVAEEWEHPANDVWDEPVEEKPKANPKKSTKKRGRRKKTGAKK